VSDSRSFDPIATVALLGDPNRRRLYDLVAANPGPVGRDDAAAALGISRELAAFHLDRLVAGGLLDAEYRRRRGRGGPGAGRPAKLYRRTASDVGVSLPPRHYERAASLFATALDGLGAAAGDVVDGTAREQGRRLGAEARREAGVRPDSRRTLAALIGMLEVAGFEPEPNPLSGDIRLRNCPYRTLSEQHRDLTCGMNVAWAGGVVEGLGARRLDVELGPAPGYCCVVFRDTRPGAARPAGRAARS
jgi:predicted ArsR family transcriptional regulator